MGLMDKLKGAFASVANVAIKADQKDLMEAMVASGTLVAYADGELSDDEMKAIRDIIGSSTQLKAFGDEPMKLFDGYCDKMEASKRMGKMDLLKEISEVSGEDAERCLIMAIEVADSDADIGADEMKTLETIASKLDLKLNDFI